MHEMMPDARPMAPGRVSRLRSESRKPCGGRRKRSAMTRTCPFWFGKSPFWRGEWPSSPKSASSSDGGRRWTLTWRLFPWEGPLSVQKDVFHDKKGSSEPEMPPFARKMSVSQPETGTFRRAGPVFSCGRAFFCQNRGLRRLREGPSVRGTRMDGFKRRRMRRRMPRLPPDACMRRS